MTRNISINNNDVNDFLNKLPKRSRSYYIEQAIMLKMSFDEGYYIRKDDIDRYISSVVSNINIADRTDHKRSNYNQINADTTNTNDMYNTIKKSITGILNL